MSTLCLIYSIVMTGHADAGIDPNAHITDKAPSPTASSRDDIESLSINTITPRKMKLFG